MPPKSSSSKKKAVLWYTCEICRVHITSRDRDGHEKYCPIDPRTEFKLPFIYEHVLFTNSLEKCRDSEEIPDIPPKQLNNIIFISEAAMKLCSLVIGEQVSVSAVEHKEMAPVVRLVWPTLDQYLTTVHVSKEDFDDNWTVFSGSQLRIEKLSSDPLPANEIEVDFLHKKPSLDTEAAGDELSKVLRPHLRGLILCVGNNIIYEFYNKKLSLLVKSLKSNSEDDESTLEKDFENLNITKNKFFVITNNTRVIVHHEHRKEIDNDDVVDKVMKEDIGGLDEIIQNIEESINIGLGLKKLPKGIKIPRGVLLYGPSGCGKTMLCEALSNTIPAEVILINTNQIFSRFFGETEKNLQKYFEIAYNNYPRPTLIIVEDVNNICPKNQTNEVIKRASASFLGLLDNLHQRPDASCIFVLATTGNIEDLNAAVRRCGRFDNEIEIGAPNPLSRKAILTKHLSKVTHSLNDSQLNDISNITHGYVGSDLANLVYKAALYAVKDRRDIVNLSDMEYAVSQVKPSAMREVLIENPNIKWNDIGGQDDLKLKLKQAIEWPLLYPEKFKKLGIKPPRGILMFGPPGCSKTMIAKALATESQVNFLSIKGPELFSMWVGESERAVREVFRKARQVAPSIIFFDEIDAIGGERSSDSGSSVKERVLTQLLTELDGVNTLQNVTVVAATNRPDMIDKALLRPGRIDRIVYIGLPDYSTRHEIFKIKLRAVPVEHNVRIEELAKRTEGYSGAEIQAVCNEAAFKALEENLDTQELCWGHFEVALKAVQPRTGPELLRIYEEYMKKDTL